MPRHRKSCPNDPLCWCRRVIVIPEDERELTNGGPVPAGNPDDDEQERPI